MLDILFPKERDFFPVFDQTAALLGESVVALLKVMEGEDKEQCIQQVCDLDQKAKLLVRESVDQLHHTFITPFDRSHMFRFLMLHSEIVSYCRLLTEKLGFYSVNHLPLESIEMVVNCGKSCSLIRRMIGQIKKINNSSETLKGCVDVAELVATNSALEFQVSRNLFSDAMDLKESMIIREINHDLSTITKKFGVLSFLIEEIILEYA